MLFQKKRRVRNDMARKHLPLMVYVIDFGDMIKIGRSFRPDERIKDVQKAIGKKEIRHFYCKSFLSVSETIVLKKLAAYRIEGEFFSFPYKKAVNMVRETIKTQKREWEKCVLECDARFSFPAPSVI